MEQNLISLIKEVAFISVITLGFILAFVVYFSNTHEKINRTFLLLTLLSVVWVSFSFLGSITKNPEMSLVLKRLNFATLLPFFVIAFFFATYFPKELKRNKLMEFVVVIIGIAGFVIAEFTNLVVKSIQRESWGNNVVGGNGFVVFNLMFFVLTVIILTNLIQKYYVLDKINKSKVIYILTGTVLYGSFNIVFNVVLPMINGSYKYDSFGDFSVIFFLLLTAYAIIKHQLFNIKVIVTETTVVALSIGLVIDTFMSNSLSEGLLKAIIWVLATYGGYVLVKSVKTEIKQKDDLAELTEDLEEANLHLQELDETKDNFLSMASHELNTPIAAIEGYLSMVLEEKMAGEIKPKLKEYLTNVFNSSKRLAALVKDLLNVSRIESNRVHIIYTQAQIEDVIDQAMAEIQLKAKTEGHKLIFEKPEHTLPKTYLDAPRIIEVLINFIGNAIKYTDPPGKIVVAANADDKKIVVSVADNGRGIPKEKYDHIFEKFSQVDVLKDEVKGTGLGMFISKNLIELQKGKIWFKSSVDPEHHGTTFYFSLPILKEKPFDPHEGEGALFQTDKKPAANNVEGKNAGDEKNISAPATTTSEKDQATSTETMTPKPKV